MTMRKNNLRDVLDHHLKYDHTKSYREKKYRYYVLHKTIRDLYHVGSIPRKWHGLTKDHLVQLILYWQSKHLKPATLMKYMTVIRWFLKKINHTIFEIDNKSLNITHHKKNKKELSNMQLTQDALPIIPKLLIKFQVDFGLTWSEATRLIPTLHLQQDHLWITRDIAHDSQDRHVPIRYEKQREILDLFQKNCNKNQNLIATMGFHHLRYLYNTSLKEQNLPTLKSYRYLYAKNLHNELNKTLSKEMIAQIIMKEMGISSKMTLWRYFNE